MTPAASPPPSTQPACSTFKSTSAVETQQDSPTNQPWEQTNCSPCLPLRNWSNATASPPPDDHQTNHNSQELLPGHESTQPEETTSLIPTSISPSTSAPILHWAGIPTLTAQRSAATTSKSLDAPCQAATSSISTTADQPPSATSYIVPTWAIST